jgi:hypothetical protein
VQLFNNGVLITLTVVNLPALQMLLLLPAAQVELCRH